MTEVSAPDTRQKTVDQILAGLLEGIPLRKAVQRGGIALSTFQKWLADNREWAVAYARTLELRADLLIDDALELVDGDGDPAKVRNQMEMRKWTATKHNQKRYGERVDLNVTQTIDVSSTLLEARSRLSRPVSYLQDVSDVQPVGFIGVSESGPLDKQSKIALDVPAPGAEPDIFS